MKFTHYKLGRLEKGDVVEVNLRGSAANVRLMDNSNLRKYQNGHKHTFWGGLVKRSPMHIGIPRSGTWNVTVDLQGLRGTCRSGIRVIPKAALTPLPEYSSGSLAPLVRRALSDNHSALALGMSPHSEHYDVFISYATEDKEDIARPLANALEQNGLSVWYDEFELRIGCSLRRKIDEGIAKSRFGIVILSHSFFNKNWPQYELDGLVTRSMTGEQEILPIWHRVTKDEVMKQSPSLADKIARSTDEISIDEISIEITNVIRGDRVG